jgi:lipoic acid synthetase
MVGLGETKEEILQTLKDLRSVQCDILTIGQYIQPSKLHLEVDKYYTEEEFEELKELAKKARFEKYQIAPLVRSSYNAFQLFQE